MRCKKCSFAFDRSTKVPKMIRCGHIFCLECLNTLPSQADGINIYRCPTCDGIIIKTEGSFAALPTAWDLISEDSSSKPTAKCSNPKHITEEVQFYCKTCSQAVCGRCVTLNHRDPNAHELCDIEDGINIMKKALQSKVNSLKKHKKKIDDQQQCISNLLQQSKTNCSNVKQEVESTFEEVVTLAESQKKQILDKIATIGNAQMKKNEDTLQEMKEESYNYERMIKQAKAALEGNDFNEIGRVIMENMNASEAYQKKSADITFIEIVEATRNKKQSISRIFGSVNEWSISPCPIPDFLSFFVESNAKLTDLTITDSGNIVLRSRTKNYGIKAVDSNGKTIQVTKNCVKPVRFCAYPSDNQAVLFLDQTSTGLELKVWNVDKNRVILKSNFGVNPNEKNSYGLTLSGIFPSKILVFDPFFQLLKEIRDSGEPGDNLIYSAPNGIKYLAGHEEVDNLVVLNLNFRELVGMKFNKEIWRYGKSEQERWRGMAMDSQGSVIVIDTVEQKIIRLSPSGKHIQTLLDIEDKASSLAGLAYNEEAHLMATVDKISGRVNVYTM